MASLTISSAAERTLVSGSSRVTAAGESRPTGRRIDLRTAVLAFVIVGLVVAGALPPAAQATALASASVEIKSLVWRRATGAAPSATDPILTTRFLNPAPPIQQQRETVLRGGTEFFEFSGDFDGAAYFSFDERSISGSAGLAPLTAGPNCEGPGCPGPANLDPLTPPPVSDFAGNYGTVDGYFTSMPNNPSIQTSLTQGVRSDLSLNTLESGSSAGRWDSSTILDSTSAFNTYFEIEFEAHALAYADSSEQVANADASLVLSISGGQNALDVSWPVFALSSFSGEADYNKTLIGSLNSYTALGDFIRLALTPDDKTSYNVRVVARTNVSAGVPVPLPGVVWLLGAGLMSLAAVRARRARRGRLPRGGLS
jgi:hypothetical protein